MRWAGSEVERLDLDANAFDGCILFHDGIGFFKGERLASAFFLAETADVNTGVELEDEKRVSAEIFEVSAHVLVDAVHDGEDDDEDDDSDDHSEHGEQ